MNCVTQGTPVNGYFRLELLQSDIWKLSVGKWHPFFGILMCLYRNNSELHANARTQKWKIHAIRKIWMPWIKQIKTSYLKPVGTGCLWPKNTFMNEYEISMLPFWRGANCSQCKSCFGLQQPAYGALNPVQALT